MPMLCEARDGTAKGAGMAGGTSDIGVLGGIGIGCLGALGDKGMVGNAFMPRGDKGGDATGVTSDIVSRRTRAKR